MHTLHLHPDSRCAALTRIEASVERPSPKTLKFSYTLTGEPRSLILPRPATPTRTDGLWKHTCLEAFVRVGDMPGYIELNFSPSGEWAAYCFTSYREGMVKLGMKTPPRIEARATQSTYMLTADVELDLPAPPWHLALTAVIEEAGGRKSYWALAHAAGKPDFHHADGFSLELN